MSYIKSGIVTRIDIVKKNKESLDYINKSFDLNLFNKVNNHYLLKEDILQKNLYSYKNEYMSFSEKENDSLNNCEAYTLETDINTLLTKKIHLQDFNKKYYFEDFEDFIFEVDYCNYLNNKININLLLIPIFWDINKAVSEDFALITVTVNNLTRKAMKNVLKGASWFTII